MITTKYFYDFEFLDDGTTIDPISIGIVCSDGREYYAVNATADWVRILKHEWLMENVVRHLPLLPADEWFNNGTYADILDEKSLFVKPRLRIAQEVLDFMLGDGWGEDRSRRELWAWYGAYDFVALCQLWGKMIDIPDAVPMFTCDLKQTHERLGCPPRPPQIDIEHHALDDARYNKVLYDYFAGLEAEYLAEASARVACCSLDRDTAEEVLMTMNYRKVHSFE